MKYKLKLKLKLFGYSLLGVLTLISILIYAYYNDRSFEVGITIMFFYLFKRRYEKQYHSSSLFTCSIISFIVFIFVTKSSISLSCSLLFTIILTYIINTVSYYVRDYLDIKRPTKKKKNTNRQLIIDILNSDDLSEEYIEEFCTKHGLVNMSETIYLFLNNTLEDTSEILDVDPSTITRRINRFIKECRK